VDIAFKLITFLDLRVAADAADHVEEITRRRIQKDPSVQEVASYLIEEDDGVFRATSGTGISSVRSRVGKASKRLSFD